MKREMISLVLILLIISAGFGVVSGTSVKLEENRLGYVSGELIVGFYIEPGKNRSIPVNVDTINSFEGYNIKRKIEELNVALLEVPNGKEENIMTNIIASSLVKYAELNDIFYICHTPNDPKWSQQWGIKRIHCKDAWDVSTGSDNVKIAIVDTGIDYNHEDISDHYVSGGYDWVNNDNDPMDDNSHGTHCAGIASAVMDNNKGVAGVAQVKIMAEKVLDQDGYGNAFNIAQGITHAADNGVDIISMSFGSTSNSSTMYDACKYAYKDKGVLLVAAAGNDGVSSLDYPAAFGNVVAVGALDKNDQRWSNSNYGEGLELIAPGVEIISTIPNDGYGLKTGTSMAAPHVAGVAALVKSQYPDKDNVWIRQKIDETAEDLGPTGWDEDYGYGLVDAALSGGQFNWPKVILKIHKVEGIDDLDGPLGGEPEWYYNVSVDSESFIEYNGYEVELLPGWFVFVWNSENTWIPDETYSFDAKQQEVTIKIKLMEHDKLIEGGVDDLADVSSHDGGGVDNSVEDKRGAIFQATYNLATDELTGDYVEKDGEYLVTSGEGDGSTTTDENDAKIWFTVTDTYEKPGPDLAAYGDLNWGDIKPGSTVTGVIYVENVGTPDPYGHNNLSWEVTEWPSWGIWTFMPKSGTKLKPEDGKIPIQVTVNVPKKKNHEFTGKIKIENTEDSSDFEYIDVSLTTKKGVSLIYELIMKLLERFPLLKQLLENLFI